MVVYCINLVIGDLLIGIFICVCMVVSILQYVQKLYNRNTIQCHKFDFLYHKYTFSKLLT